MDHLDPTSALKICPGVPKQWMTHQEGDEGGAAGLRAVVHVRHRLVRWPHMRLSALAILFVMTACSQVEPPPGPLVPSPPVDEDPPPTQSDAFDFWRRSGSEQVVQLLEEYAKARNGEPADLDGDGVSDTTASSIPDGGMRWVFDPEQEGRFRWVVEQSPSGDLVTLIDGEGDGTLDIREQVAADGSRRVVWEDTNSNGVFDARRTETTEATGVRVVEEKDPTETGTFTRVAEYTLPLELGKGERAECNDEVLPDPPKNDEVQIIHFAGQPTFRVVVDAAKASCSDYDQPKVVRALECALGKVDSRKGLGCLENTNALMGQWLRSRLLWKKITIACGVFCDSWAAKTLGWERRSTLVNLNTGYLTDDADANCEIMFHELLHATGVAPPGENHNDGDPKDRVYACALYCSGCRIHSSPEPSTEPAPTANENCARCARTPEERAQCGIEQKLKDLPREECSDYLLCHGPVGTLRFCDECQGFVDHDCLGQPLNVDAGEFYCCKSCPADANQSNDMPCGGAPTVRSSCNEPPPMCQ